MSSQYVYLERHVVQRKFTNKKNIIQYDPTIQISEVFKYSLAGWLHQNPEQNTQGLSIV